MMPGPVDRNLRRRLAQVERDMRKTKIVPVQKMIEFQYWSTRNMRRDLLDRVRVYAVLARKKRLEQAMNEVIEAGLQVVESRRQTA